MRKVKKFWPLLIIICLSIFVSKSLTGCGSGGGDGDNGSPPPVQPLSGSVIKGTVPGTIIHVIGDDGSYFKTETDPSDPPPRTFQIQVKPGIGYRLVLEEGNSLFPLVFKTEQGLDTNRFYMSIVEGTLDLGNITVNGGTATPQNNPLSNVDSNGDGLMDFDDPSFELLSNDPLDVDGDGIPNFLDLDFAPGPSDTDGDGIPDSQDFDSDNNGIQDTEEVGEISDAELLQKGLAQISSLNFIGAFARFDELVRRNPQHQIGNFGLAISRIGAVLTDLSPGTDPSKLETIKEILDRFGFNPNGRQLDHFTSEPAFISKTEEVFPGFLITEKCHVFPDNSPTPNEIREYIKSKISPQIQGAINNLNEITPDFNQVLLDHPIIISNEIFNGELDYSDVLAFSGALRAAQISISIFEVYNIQFDLDRYLNGFCEDIDPQKYQQTNVEAFLNQYPNLGKLENPSILNGLKELAVLGIDDFIASLDAVFNEQDSQGDDFLTIDKNDYPHDRGVLESIKASFDTPVTVAEGTEDEFTIFLGPFFAGLDLRQFVPTFMEDMVVYSSIRDTAFDPTFGGVLPNFSREDVVKVFDEVSPTVQVPTISGPVSNPVSFQIDVIDIETLPNNTTQIGSGLDPSSVSIFFFCNVGCGVSGFDSNNNPVTFGNFSNIASLFQISGPDSNGTYTISPNGSGLSFSSSGNISISIFLTDLAGNFGFGFMSFSVFVQ